MANSFITQKVMNKVRTTVSGDRKRYKTDEFDLDLSYINPNVVAMSFPASGVEAVWRNRIDDVVDMLNKNHGQRNFMIWNLSERSYKYEKFDNQIIHIPFPDHHPPPMELLIKIVQTIDSWLRADESNVAIIHCMGGKGRTGTVITSYLFFTGAFETIEAAEDHFAKARSMRSRGVTQPSQRRYVRYFSTCLTQMRGLNLQKIYLKQMEIGPVPATKQYRIEIYDSTCNGKLLFSYSPKPASLLRFDIGIDVRGDIYFKVQQKKNDNHYKDRFHVVLHSYFVDRTQETFKKKDLDLLERDKKFDEDLTVCITFTPPVSDEILPDIDPVMENIRVKFQKYQNRGTKFKRAYRRVTLGRSCPNSVMSFHPLVKSVKIPLEVNTDLNLDSLPDFVRRAPLRKAQSTIDVLDDTPLTYSSAIWQRKSWARAIPTTGGKKTHNRVMTVDPDNYRLRNSADLSLPSVKNHATEQNLNNVIPISTNVGAIIPSPTGPENVPFFAPSVDEAMEKIENYKRKISTSKPTKIAKVLFDFKAELEDEISLQKDELVTVTVQAYDEWWYGYVGNRMEKRGYFPRKYVELMMTSSTI
eukprot:TRINITY_DN87_c0_g1_i1.p1 TRINITY_DN87_c0_g1~~TRINITY_DN87_c0_g1_i1.p1  ORF type:complete len:584 (+),score=118.34 TRINITY_DN87_c0_g1_i1:41-1792(+)